MLINRLQASVIVVIKILLNTVTSNIIIFVSKETSSEHRLEYTEEAQTMAGVQAMGSSWAAA